MPMSPEKRQLALRVNVVCLTMVWLASSTALVINGHLGVERAVLAYLFIGLAWGLLARMLLGRAVWTAFSKSERGSSIAEKSAWPVRGLATVRRWWPIVTIVYALLSAMFVVRAHGVLRDVLIVCTVVVAVTFPIVVRRLR
jgi:hypothetical protein